MKRKPDLLDEKEKTQDAVAQITSWCIAVAVHQRYGVGRDRLERVAAVMARVQDEIAAIVEDWARPKEWGCCGTSWAGSARRSSLYR